MAEILRNTLDTVDKLSLIGGGAGMVLVKIGILAPALLPASIILAGSGALGLWIINPTIAPKERQ